ncbi:MAG: hypothetical protein A2289_01155 [Deltaproteobacteria bacterium RIFOXYA12_FULL_58_15]|nr:MAG: hypothetical protein A2289_01155 [Deltaproteobacteria bacterium RIFOXYA12_FULL_58_15]OGR14721.1 MAG: hypothetical protein A2341_05055 [Deltaproteobacteria bacterium RIFOXYB12_FULL_58_9]
MRLTAVFVILLFATGEAEEIQKLVDRARELALAKTTYDSAYRALNYPNGDPPSDVGVCTDIVVRAFRAIGKDLQSLVQEDMRKNFAIYQLRKRYQQKRPDPNIDHRRVNNLMTFFARHGKSLAVSLDEPKLWKGGDIVIFDLYGNGDNTHIGIISNALGDSGLPLVFHHFPPHPAESDCLRDWVVTGHYRYP